MSPTAVTRLVARLFAASGRDFGQTHIQVYVDGLADVSDDLGDAAGRDLIRVVSWANPPSVHLVREHVELIRLRRDRSRPAIPDATGAPVDPEEARRHLAEIRKRRCGEPQRVVDSIPRLRTPGAHAFGDHGLCGPSCDAMPTPDPDGART